VFGRVPETPYQLTSKVVTEDDRTIDGRATLQIVELTISIKAGKKYGRQKNQQSFIFPIHVFLPNKPKDTDNSCPAFVLICNRSRKEIDPYPKQFTEYWPVPDNIDHGFATAAFYAGDVDPDDQNDDFRNGIHPLFDIDQPRTDVSWGCISSWAFAASRVLDYLSTASSLRQRVDATKVVVIGHSRGGKTALWAAAQDERFVMAVSNNSGCTGAALSRRKADGRHGETVAQINEVFPNWFCGNYRIYNNNEEALPVDQHMLLALIAPRALCVASATEDDWADPEGEYLSLHAAAPAWSLLFEGDASTTLPDKQPDWFQTEKLSYHLRPGDHDLLVYDWHRYMSMARRVFAGPTRSCDRDDADLSCLYRCCP